MNDQISVSPVGDKCIQIHLGNSICPEVNKQVRSFFLMLQSKNIPGILECVPTYCTLSVYYDPLVIAYKDLLKELHHVKENLKDFKIPQPYVIEIPTCYHEDFGPDIHFVAEHNQLTIEEVISIHSNNEYLIYMLGFTPGYCYLGGMSEKIAAPRLSKPRTAVAAGSVGIAGTQTGIYPIESPGGWQLIGRTPLDLYNPDREENPILLEAGNYIRFFSITKEEYRDIQQDINQNCYQVKKYLKRI